IVISFIVYLLYANKKIKVTNYTFKNSKVGKKIRIVHLSDIHNDIFGKDNRNLYETVKKCCPDVIFITGDLLDSRRTDINRALFIAGKLTEIAPVYYVTGNHESRIKKYPVFEKGLKDLGIYVLNNEVAQFDCLKIYGLQDPGFTENNKNRGEIISDDHLQEMDISTDERYINVLLVHRPHYFKTYCKYPLDFIFSGHAHGGQMRLPLLGGLYAPGQGILPKYDSGIYKDNTVTMILSRGLGNSLFPLRIFNNPEVIVTDIVAEDNSGF
ncbi:MAG: metallophosphoesterase, partial [Erysipelotrichia bacterium]|nr:metallophosphoesterase [Erysipelotrichia bacterium]